MNNLIISYLTLRKLIGILGVALAAFCVMGGILFGTGNIEQSISAYYMTNMRDVFVAVLAVAGAFLMTYKGYDKLDNVLSTIAGSAAIGVAFFPMAYVAPGSIFNIGMPVIGRMHYVSAAIFFLVLSFISFFQFTKGGDNPSKKKAWRNLVYRICGITMFSSIVLVFIEKITPINGGPYFVLIMEALMLFAFGFSWFVKGEAILADE